MDLTIHLSKNNSSRLPRARGDGPLNSSPDVNICTAPPRTRGWTLPGEKNGRRLGGSPAHAGMDLGDRCREPKPLRLPRARGDGPQGLRETDGPVMAPPRTRGWTFSYRLNPKKRKAPPRTRGWTPIEARHGRAM